MPNRDWSVSDYIAQIAVMIRNRVPQGTQICALYTIISNLGYVLLYMSTFEELPPTPERRQTNVR